MRYSLTWTRTTTFRTDLRLTDLELAQWAAADLTERARISRQGQLDAPTPLDLVRLLEANPHFRTQLLELYLEETHTNSTPT